MYIPPSPQVLASEMFGSDRHLLAFDLAEYSDRASVSRLIGAPPGYVGEWGWCGVGGWVGGDDVGRELGGEPRGEGLRGAAAI